MWILQKYGAKVCTEMKWFRMASYGGIFWRR